MSWRRGPWRSCGPPCFCVCFVGRPNAVFAALFCAAAVCPRLYVLRHQYILLRRHLDVRAHWPASGRRDCGSRRGHRAAAAAGQCARPRRNAASARSQHASRAQPHFRPRLRRVMPHGPDTRGAASSVTRPAISPAPACRWAVREVRSGRRRARSHNGQDRPRDACADRPARATATKPWYSACCVARTLGICVASVAPLLRTACIKSAPDITRASLLASRIFLPASTAARVGRKPAAPL